MKTKTTALASAAALLFLAGAATAQESDTSEAKEIKCEGVNQCKGHGACKTLFNECGGKNSCKGKGFLMLTPEECEAAKAKLQSGEEQPNG